MTASLVVVGVVGPGQPGRETLDRVLVVGVDVDVRTQLVGEPGQGDVLATPALLELFDPAISEVHGRSPLPLGFRGFDTPESASQAQPNGLLNHHRSALISQARSGPI